MTRRAGALALMSLMLASCARTTPAEKEASQAAPVTVTTATAVRGPVNDRLEAGGTVAAATSAVIASRIVAPVVSVRVKAGDRVRAGDVLIVLDERESAARTREAESVIAAAEQSLAAARTELTSAAAEQRLATSSRERIAALHERRSATTQELDEVTARLASSTARVDAAQARISQATAQVAAARAGSEAASTARSFATLTAPFDGIVTETMTDPGNLAAPGVPLARIDAVGAHRVEARIDAARAQYLHVGDRVDVFLDTFSGAAIEGIVVEMARAIGADQAFTAKVALPAGVSPASGAFARVVFRGAARQALTLPVTAIRREGQLVTAFVLDKGTARLRLVRVGDVVAGRVEVVAGLDEGEIVIVNPPPQLVDGASASAATATGRGSR